MATKNKNQQNGLTTSQAAERERLEGPNELPRAGKRSVFRIVLEVLREPMLLLLLVGGLVCLLLEGCKSLMQRVSLG